MYMEMKTSAQEHEKYNSSNSVLLVYESLILNNKHIPQFIDLPILNYIYWHFCKTDEDIMYCHDTFHLIPLPLNFYLLIL